MNISSLLNPSQAPSRPSISHILQYAAEERQRGEYVESLRFQSEASKQANEQANQKSEDATPSTVKSTLPVHPAATPVSSPETGRSTQLPSPPRLPGFDKLRLLTDRESFRDNFREPTSYPAYQSPERIHAVLTPPREETRYGGNGVYASPSKDQSPYPSQPFERIANAFIPPSPADSLTAFASIATGFHRQNGLDAFAQDIRRIHARNSSNTSRASSAELHPSPVEFTESQRAGGVSTPTSMISADDWQRSTGPMPLSPPDSTKDSGPQTPRCSYTRDCSTGSPLRKVVSHIFGRNKLCTRQIPKHVWVHYCRKHYQRSRYRNPKGFALLQCSLVRRQVERLEVWGGVIDWVVKIRKREEIRLSKEKESGGRGSVDEDDFDRDGQAKNTMSTKWLLGLTGTGKTTRDIMAVLDGIENEIRETGSGFPDLEILPNVTSADNNAPSRPDSRAQSRTSSYSGVGLGLDLGGAGLKRKASMREDTPVSRSGTPRPYAPMKRRRTDSTPMPGIEQLQRAVESGWEAIRPSTDSGIRSIPSSRPMESY